MTDRGKVDSTSLNYKHQNNARSVYKLKVFSIMNFTTVYMYVKIFMCMKVKKDVDDKNLLLNIFVKLRQGSGKDRQAMAVTAKGLKA